MQFRFLLILAARAAIVTLSPGMAGAANEPVVTVEPACPEFKMPSVAGQPTIRPTMTIRYNTESPGARLKSPQALRLILANATGVSNRYDSVTIPLVRSDGGTWQATFTPQKSYFSGYSIFFLQNEKGQVDNNHAQYWDILYCDNSQINPYGVEALAQTYEGTLLAPGIQRARDPDRAIETLNADLRARPQAASHYFLLWDLELEKRGRTPAAYEQIGKEVDTFLDAHATHLRAMMQVASFLSFNQTRLRPAVVDRYRAALIALPQTADPIEINAVTLEVTHIPRDRFASRAQHTVTHILAQFDLQAIDPNGKDPRKSVEEYLRFIAKYPATETFAAYGAAFQLQETMGDAAALEAIFEKWISVEPGEVLPFLFMAQFYVDHKIKPARALELLNAAEKLYTESESPSAHRHFHRDPGKLESLRGQAHLQAMDLPASRADFEAALKAAPDNPDIALALGKVCEQMGDNASALEAYLTAASAPYQQDPAPYRAYARLFVGQRLGSETDAEEKVEKQAAERARRAAAGYTPIPMNRPAPEFAFTDLAGKRLDNQAAKGKATVITFWGIWCAPCIAELPAMQEFESRHPAANILAVEIGDEPDKVKAFLTAHNLNALHVAVRADWPQEFGAAATPMSVVIDRFGQIQFVHVGLQTGIEAILDNDLSALAESN
jgi:thiol-disulfide isomerase/thioredoxin